jgi:hypothetical protein
MTKPTSCSNGNPNIDAASPISRAPIGLAHRIGDRLLHEAREALPPTIFFFIGFNFVVLTSNLLVAQYLIGLSNFMLATLGALVVGKAVLVANKIPLLRRYDRAALIRPILFKTTFYWMIVFLARLLERFGHFILLEHNRPANFFPYLATTFSWHRFVAISLWICILFLIYVTASEFSHLFGRGEIPRLLFTNRPSELRLNRRQRMRELLRLSRLTDEHSADEFQNPTSAAHRELIDIVRRLARSTAPLRATHSKAR